MHRGLVAAIVGSWCLVALVACGPAPTPTSRGQPTAAPAAVPAPANAPAAPAAGQSEWERTLVAARAEGKVAVAGAPGSGYRQAMAEFEKQYPDIQLEYVGLGVSEWEPRFYRERQSGLFLWDVDIHGPTTFDITRKNAGDLLPLRPMLLLPEVRDESVWFGGFRKAFLDAEQQYIFAYQAEISAQVYVNRDLVPESELSTIRELLDPRWKGKIAILDPRLDGAGNGRIAIWTGQLGEDFVRGLLRQDLGLTRDYRQLAEWLVRGRYPIAIGLSTTELRPFTQEGLGLGVRPLGGKAPEAWRLSSGFGVVRLLANAPHPNAAVVFVNWLLSREGQHAWMTHADRPSRRTDLPRMEDQSPEPDVDYFDIDHEDTLPLRDRAREISRDTLG
jgi:iron(III) transport system substrate-binding protein